ncbi:MAG: hypothetical protein A2046_05715 [Bacteroidetes bacterium GWA2_30_7]|nr:MAG: hypothetical protein A2046_05715 [Bacteroidetes bacterium GWA2_30_7]
MKFRLIIFLLIIIVNTKSYSLHSDTINVIHYEINLKFDYTNSNIIGYTDLQIKPVINGLQVVPLDLLKLTIDSITDENNLLAYNYNDTLLVVNLINTYNTSDTFNVKVYYHGKPQTDPSGFGGFYFYSGGAYNLGVAFDGKPHNYGRVWYPCIDDFIDRSTYNCIITVTTGQTAVCGGLLISTVNNGDNTTTFHWQMQTEIPTYLSSVAAATYSLVTDTFNSINGNIPIDIYVRKADSLKAINSFINLKNTLTAYEECFGPYKWERVGYVGVPFNGGAMEHATNIAYPNFAITGNLTYETLYAHELSHHWFGDLITCSTAEDMWINEGWASYCEAIFKEKVYSKEQAKTYIRATHEKNLRYLHIEDNGFRAVYGVPHEYTYSSTVYEKGSGVAHSLRGYLGDSLFFSSIKSLLNAYSYKPISSFEMRDYLSSVSGIELNSFYNAWVFSPGFMHFSIDSFKVIPSGNEYEVIVSVKQRSRGTNFVSNDNRIEITFIDNSWVKHTELLQFSGETGIDTFYIPINPSLAILDLEEKLCDATTDNYKTLKTTGQQSFDKAYFIAEVVSVIDSAFLRAEYNWVEPDNFKTYHKGIYLSQEHYWKIDGLIPDNFRIKGRFSYNKTTSSSSGYLDNKLMTNSSDSLVLFYRKSPAYDWEVTSFTKSGYALYGYLIADTLKVGEYTFGIKDFDRLQGYIQNNSCNGIGKLSAKIEGGTPPYSYKWNNAETTNFIENILTGKYKVTVVDAISDTLVLTYWNNIPSSIQLNFIIPDTLTSNCTNSISATVFGGFPPYSYQWNDSQNQQTATASNLCAGSYTLTVTDSYGCTNTNIVDIFTGITKIDENKITNFPNPFNNKTVIKFNNPNNSKYSLKITDISGKTVKEIKEINGNNIEINRKGFTSGVYYVELIGEKRFNTKMIIE